MSVIVPLSPVPPRAGAAFAAEVPLLCGLPGAPCVPWLLHHHLRGPTPCPGAVILGWCLEPCTRWPCFTIKGKDVQLVSARSPSSFCTALVLLPWVSPSLPAPSQE